MFNRPEHVDNYKSISALKYKVNKAEVPQYVEEFEHVARDDVLMIANISLEEIQVCDLYLFCSVGSLLCHHPIGSVLKFGGIPVFMQSLSLECFQDTK